MVISDLHHTYLELERDNNIIDLYKKVLTELNMRLCEGFIYTSDFNMPRLAYGSKYSDFSDRPFFISIFDLRPVFVDKQNYSLRKEKSFFKRKIIDNWYCPDGNNKVRLNDGCLEVERVHSKYFKSSAKFTKEETEILDDIVFWCCEALDGIKECLS